MDGKIYGCSTCKIDQNMTFKHLKVIFLVKNTSENSQNSFRPHGKQSVKDTSTKLEAANLRIELIERKLRGYESTDTPVTQASIDDATNLTVTDRKY